MKAFSIISILLVSLTAVSAESDPPVVTALRTPEAIALDGRADEEVWKRAKESRDARISEWRMMEDGSEAPGERFALFAYDDDFLYVFYSVVSEDVELLLSNPATPETGDCVRLEIADASMGVDCENRNLGLLQPYLIPLESAVARGEDGWTAELAIPWEHVGGLPAPGEQTAFNITANDTTHGRITWAPVRDPRDMENLGVLEVEISP